MSSLDEQQQQLFKGFLSPQIVALVVTRSSQGVINVSPTEWCQKVSYDPPMISLCKKHSSDAAHHLRVVGKSFVISVPTIQDVEDVLLCSQHIPSDQSELSIDGVRFSVRETVGDYVYLDHMVWEATCKVLDWMDMGTHTMFVAQVLRLQADYAKMHSLELMHVTFKTFAQVGKLVAAKGW